MSMARARPIRIYIQTEENRFARFLWFHNPHPNEMLMAISGLNSSTSVLDSEYPLREVSEAELVALQYSYADATRILRPVDHITCHPDGRFHIRTRDEDLYVHRMQRVEPLGPDTPIYLEFVILSDQAGHYNSTTKEPKNPHVVFKAQPEHLVVLRGMFSGARFNLEKIFGDTITSVTGDRNFSSIHVKGETLHGYLHWQALSLPDEVIKSRPRGTILSFKFPLAGDRYHIKSFLFA